MMLYTGSRIDAAEAERIGLVNRTVADEDLSDAVVDIARAIADNAPLSIAASKVAIAQSLRDPADRDMETVNRALATCFDSADYREGRAAFLEKRPPRFQGV
jgi:enoyl-CoA hydratase